MASAPDHNSNVNDKIQYFEAGAKQPSTLLNPVVNTALPMALATDPVGPRPVVGDCAAHGSCIFYY